MHPFTAMFIAVVTPLSLIALMIGPVYGSAYLGLIWYYGEEVASYAWNPDYMLRAYDGLYTYWMENASDVSYMEFVLPVFGPLVLGVMLGLLLEFFFVLYIKSIFSAD